MYSGVNVRRVGAAGALAWSGSVLESGDSTCGVRERAGTGGAGKLGQGDVRFSIFHFPFLLDL